MSVPGVRSILMTTDAVGGVWGYALQLAEALAPHDVHITLLVMGGEPSDDQRRQAERLANVQLITTDLKLEWMPRPDADLARADHLLLDLESAARPDLVHINGYANAAAGFAGPVVVVAHSCVSTWWQACRGEEVPPEWDAYEQRLRRGVAAADCVVAPTRAYLEAFNAIHGVPRKTRVIANGRNSGRFRPRRKRLFALAAGRFWDEAKNLPVLLEAAALLDRPLRIAGDGAPPDGTPDNVSMLGRLSERALADRMAEAAVFVAPARYEPFGLAILEAAHSGCALVLGDIPTLRELWDGAAIFVDPEDAAAIATAVETMLGDLQRAEALGEAARSRAERYGSDAMGEAYLRLYRDLLTACPSASDHTEAAA